MQTMNTSLRPTFLSDIYTSLQTFDAEHLSLIHELSGAMLRDARTHLNRPLPEDPYLRSFQFGCGHSDDIFIFSLDPLRLASVQDIFRGEPCLSCLSLRLTHQLEYAVSWRPPKLQVNRLNKLAPAEINRWNGVLTLSDYLSDLPPDVRQAWQGLAPDILAVLEQTDGETWLQSSKISLAKRILEIACLDQAEFERVYERTRPNAREHQRALTRVLEFEDTSHDDAQDLEEGTNG